MGDGIRTLNIGYRHIAVYRSYILAGARLLRHQPAPGGRRAGILYGLFAAESLFAYPNYIAYFNPLVPRGWAHQHLVDSNLDWGQDLPGPRTVAPNVQHGQARARLSVLLWQRLPYEIDAMGTAA
jgi:hypothetical protein